MMKITTWNVNGLRAVLKKGFLDYLKESGADILGIQETKLQEDQLPEEVREPFEYKTAWNYAEKKGYSGTGVFFKEEPVSVRTEFDEEVLNHEGRIIELKYPGFTLFNIYFPNGQMSEERLQYKLEFYEKFFSYTDEYKKQGRSLIITGDYNTAHNEIDLKNPKPNEKTSGFLRIERDWLDRITKNGYTDTFRYFHPDTVKYSWWTYRFKARDRNVGWRIDYFFVTKDIIDKGWIKKAFIDNTIYGSDHCPIGLVLEI